MRRFLVCLILAANCSAFGPRECELPDSLCDPQGLLGLWLATQPYTRFVVSANSGPNSLTVFSAARGTGGLTKVNDFAVVGSPSSLAYRASTGHLFVATGGAIYVYEMSGSGGLTMIQGVGSNVDQIVLHPNGRFLYATRGASNLVSAYSVAANGVPSIISSLAATLPSGIAIDPKGLYLYSAQSGTGLIDQFLVDQSGGLTSQGIPLNLGCTGSSLATAASDTVVFSCANQFRPARINSTGILSGIGAVFASNSRQSAIISSGLVMLGAYQTAVGVYSVTSSTTLLSTAGSNVYKGLALDYTGQFAWATTPSAVETYQFSGTTLAMMSSLQTTAAGTLLLPVNY